MVGVAPMAHHYSLLQSYLLNLHRGRIAVRRMIIRDLLGYLDIGAHRSAADALVVLRLFLSEQDEISRSQRRQASGQRAAGLDQALPRQRRALTSARRGHDVTRAVIP